MFSYCQIGEELRFLITVAQTPGQVDASRIGLQQADDDAQQGGLSGTVLPDQPEDLSPARLERYSAQYASRAIGLGDVVDGKRRCVHRNTATS